MSVVSTEALNRSDEVQEILEIDEDAGDIEMVAECSGSSYRKEKKKLIKEKELARKVLQQKRPRERTREVPKERSRTKGVQQRRVSTSSQPSASLVLGPSSVVSGATFAASRPSSAASRPASAVSRPSSVASGSASPSASKEKSSNKIGKQAAAANIWRYGDGGKKPEVTYLKEPIEAVLDLWGDMGMDRDQRYELHKDELQAAYDKLHNNRRHKKKLKQSKVVS